MKSFDMRAFSSYLKAESMSEDSINKFTHYLEDFLMYGKRKPYMPANSYNKLFDKQVKYLDSLNYNLNNAFIVKILSCPKYSWQNIKFKLPFFLNGVKRKLNEFDYYIWFRTINDLDYEVYICFDFKDDNIKKQHVDFIVKEQWYGYYAIKDQSLQEDKTLTWFLNNAKIFLHSPTFGIDKNKIQTENSILSTIERLINDEAEFDEYVGACASDGPDCLRPIPLEAIF